MLSPKRLSQSVLQYISDGLDKGPSRETGFCDEVDGDGEVGAALFTAIDLVSFQVFDISEAHETGNGWAISSCAAITGN